MVDSTDGGESRHDSRRKELRKKIEHSIEVARDQQRMEMQRRRLETARNGLKCYERKQYPEAVRYFVTYLKILEDWKGVASEGLHPGVFDQKKDAGELLLVNSIYWNMVRLFDRTSENGKGNKEFMHYLEKYIAFTKGMPFQPLAAETLRKYMRSRIIVHKNEIKHAYRIITGSRCFVATSLSDLDHPKTVPTLRVFRDRILRKAALGRWLVKSYYRVGPVLADRLDQAPGPVRQLTAWALDALAFVLRCVRLS